MYRNIYEHYFSAKCPVNGDMIDYHLTIESSEMIEVEKIVDATDDLQEGYHEIFADQLIALLGGFQIITAHHHGVDIKTMREKS
jgi:hypothetical protein